MIKKTSLAIIREHFNIDGGAERFIDHLSKALEKEKLDIHMISRNNWKNLTNKWHLHICNPPKLGRLSRKWGFEKSVHNFLKDKTYDIVQTHERIPECTIFRAGDGVHRVWLERRSRILSPIRYFISNKSAYHQYLLKIEKKIFHSQKLKAVICNSKMVKEEILQFFSIQKNKIRIIYNAVDLNHFKPTTEILRYYIRKKLDLSNNSIVFTYVGSGFERKGLESAIKALKNTNCYLIIVGKDKNLNYYKQLGNRLNLLKYLRFVGVQRNVRPFYNAADAFLLPTFYDPFPNTILEAMASGLPVITSNYCGGAEFITQGKNGFVCDPFNIKELTEAITSIPSISINPKMGETAHKNIQPYTFQRLANEMIKLYKEILK